MHNPQSTAIKKLVLAECPNVIARSGLKRFFFSSLQGDFEFLLIAYRLLAHFHVVHNVLRYNPGNILRSKPTRSPAEKTTVVQKSSSAWDVATVVVYTVHLVSVQGLCNWGLVVDTRFFVLLPWKYINTDCWGSFTSYLRKCQLSVACSQGAKLFQLWKHLPEENVFLFKSILKLYLYMRMFLFLSTWTNKKVFIKKRKCQLYQTYVKKNPANPELHFIINLTVNITEIYAYPRLQAKPSK